MAVSAKRAGRVSQDLASHSYRRIKGTTETSYDGTTLATYNATTNTISEQPASGPPHFDDPVATLHQLLASGDAKIVTTKTLNRRRVYEISTRSAHAVLNGTIYADASTYAPVRAELQPPPTCPESDCAGLARSRFTRGRGS